MKFSTPLYEATFIRRFKRFFTEGQLGTEVVLAHTPNTGAMTSTLEPGGRIYLSRVPPHSARKLQYTLELTQMGETFIDVNTSRTNALVEEALVNGVIKEIGRPHFLKREHKIGDSRLDFYFENTDGSKGVIEVKNVTLKNTQGAASFPDAQSSRALKHVELLRELNQQGFKTYFIFVINRQDVEYFTLAQDIDPKYCQSLKLAQQEGVQSLAYQSLINLQEIKLAHPIPIIF